MNSTTKRLGMSLLVGVVLTVGTAAVAYGNGAFDPTIAQPTPVEAVATDSVPAFTTPALAPAAGVLPPTLAGDIDALTQAPAGVAESVLPGAAVAAQARSLVSRGPWQLVGVPTSKGGVCLLLYKDATAVSSACVDGFRAGENVVYVLGDRDGLNAGDPPYVFGVTRGAIKDVSVVADDMSFPATFSEGAFFFQPSESASLQKLDLTSADGSRQSVVLPPMQRIPG